MSQHGPQPPGQPGVVTGFFRECHAIKLHEVSLAEVLLVLVVVLIAFMVRRIGK